MTLCSRILQLGLATVFIASMAGCASIPEKSSRSVYEQSLNGAWAFVPASGAPENPQLPETDIESWNTIEVPSNWYLQGHELSGAAWYKRKFRVDALTKKSLARLSFEAVDYAADVWVNGHHLGRHQGYFDRFGFTVTEHLIVGRDNDITVRVDSPEEQKSDWSLNKRLIKGVLSHHDTRPGGAWSDRGQEANTGGIWGGVTLSVTDGVALIGIRWRDNVDTDSGSADTTVSLNVESTDAAAGKHWIRITESDPENRHKPTVTFEERAVRAGQSTLEIQLPQRKVFMWNPWEQGAANRYRYEVEIGRGSEVVAKREISRGIRKIRVDAETGEWRVNGVRIFLRGTNYIPSQWLSEMTESRFRFDLELMRRAHINAVRVHALVLPELFYRLADEYGILVWQDFPLQWGYADDAVFHAEAKRQLQRMIRQFGSFASIVAWSMHNEPPWDASWMKYKYDGYDPEQNRDLDAMLSETASQEDSSRHIHMASLTSEHPWFGWYSGTVADYGRPVTEKLITEFGAQALPSMDSLQRIFVGKTIWPQNEKDWEAWRFHNFQTRETFEIAKVNKGESVKELVNNTQDYQRRLIKFAAESYRRNRYNKVGGIFQFMFVESWPSVNWGVVDYRRNTKPGYDAMRLAYQPVLPSVVLKKEKFEAGDEIQIPIWVVNDLHKSFDQAKIVSTIWKGEAISKTRSTKFRVMPDSAALADTWAVSSLPIGDYTVKVDLIDKDGEILGVNHEKFSIAPRYVSASGTVGTR